MNVVVFGLTVSSSWGNGHATLWRGLIKALIRRGHAVTFFERDVSYYAQNRDLHALEGGRLVLYPDWDAVRDEARRAVASADVAVVTSYCPDALPAGALMFDAQRPVRLFYDLDTPVTLSRLGTDSAPAYVGPRGFADYDLVLSYTGGAALDALRTRLGARRVAPLYGHADPDTHRPVPPEPRFAAAMSYLGTYAADRQAALDALFVGVAARRPDAKFLIGGAQYPADFPWRPNIFFVQHLPPSDHPGFFASGRLTLKVTRAAMAAAGWCPSGRLFEAAACGAAILSDPWEGFETFFEPEREVLLARTAAEALAGFDLSDEALVRVGRAGRERVLAEHTSAHRARDFEAAVEMARRPQASGG